MFNKGKNLGMIGRLLGAMFREALLYPTRDSVFLDSALNKDGLEQAKELQDFLFNKRPDDASVTPVAKEAMGAMRGDGASSVVVSSNLRRALQTTTVALWPRIRDNSEKINIVSSLQEISRNVDTKALASRKEIPDLHTLVDYCPNFDAEAVYDPKENMGNKAYGFTGVKRINRFAEWAFSRKEEYIVVGGHSLWFKNFFRLFLDRKSTHQAKNMKLVNSGAVTFTLHRCMGDLGEPRFRIDESSLEVVSGGYTKS